MSLRTEPNPYRSKSKFSFDHSSSCNQGSVENKVDDVIVLVNWTISKANHTLTLEEYKILQIRFRTPASWRSGVSSIHQAVQESGIWFNFPEKRSTWKGQ